MSTRKSFRAPAFTGQAFSNATTDRATHVLQKLKVSGAQVPMQAREIHMHSRSSGCTHWAPTPSACSLTLCSKLCTRSAAVAPLPGRSWVRASHRDTPAASRASSLHFSAVASLVLLAPCVAAGADLTRRGQSSVASGAAKAGCGSGAARGLRGLLALGGGAESRTVLQ